MAEHVTTTPRGFRDVHWCAIANEPAILAWRGDVAFCALCGMVDDERGPGAERGPKPKPPAEVASYAPQPAGWRKGRARGKRAEETRP